MKLRLETILMWTIVALSPFAAITMLFAVLVRLKAAETYWVESVQVVVGLAVVVASLKALFPWPHRATSEKARSFRRHARILDLLALPSLLVLYVAHRFSFDRNDFVLRAIVVSAICTAVLWLGVELRERALGAQSDQASLFGS